MTDAQFYNSFCFNLYKRRHYYSTDWMKDSGSPQHYLARIVRGTAKICTAKETLHLVAGDIFYIPRGLKYRSHWYPEKDGEICLFSFGFNHFPAGEHTLYKLQKIHCNDTEKAYLTELESCITISPLSIGRLYRFIGEVCPKMHLRVHRGSDVIVNKALEFMRQNDHYTVSDIAAYCGVSESGLYAKFRQQLGETPVDARHRILTEKATELLTTTDLTIEEISGRLGFSSSSYFRKIFFAQTGKTPMAFRKQTAYI